MKQFSSEGEANAAGYDLTTRKVVGVIEKSFEKFFHNCDKAHREKRVHRACTRGYQRQKLARVKVGDEYRYSRSDVDAFIAELKRRCGGDRVTRTAP